jgi:trehalose 6-phosphate synthase
VVNAASHARHSGTAGAPHRVIRLVRRGASVHREEVRFTKASLRGANAPMPTQGTSGGRKLVVVANRLPFCRTPAGATACPTSPGGAAASDTHSQWSTSPGGLVTALAPILRSQDGSWIGWDGEAGKAPKPFDHEGIHSVPVPLTQREIDGFYKGFSNRTLWPLYHDAVRRPIFEPKWWKPYSDVNRRFADYASREAAENAVVWVQDYHLQLVPAMLRKMRPDLRIGFFLHIPFPPQELFAQLPWRKPLLEGLLGTDLFACHTETGAHNFAQLAIRYAGAQWVDTSNELRYDNRLVRYGALPISIDVKRFEEIARSRAAQEKAAAIRRELGEHRKLLLGVDRLDYTKGIDIRLNAYQQLLEKGALSPDNCVLVQTCVPTRSDVLEYVKMREKVEQIVGAINGRFGKIGQVAVHYLHQTFELEDLVPLYLAADVMLVTPLRDGMNLISKEYVASRVDGGGVLVLSEFAGAAHELVDALLINPYDLEALAKTILRAVEMNPDEARRRMAELRRVVAGHDVYRWADEFLSVLAA